MAFHQTRNDIITVWFKCRLCEGSFQEVDQFIRHKRDWHPLDFGKTNCIIFEEKPVAPDLEDSDPEQYELPFASNNNSYVNSLPTAGDGFEFAEDVTPQVPVPVRVKQEPAFVELLTYENLEEIQDDEPNTDAYFDMETFADDSVHVHPLNEGYPENLSSIVRVEQPNPAESLSPIFESATEEASSLHDPIVLVESLTLEQLQTASNYHPTNLKQFKCPVQNCFASFRRQYELTRHSASSRHTDYRPFKCHHQGCLKAFKTKKNLKRHSAVHTNGALSRSALIKKQLKKRVVTKFPFNMNRPSTATALQKDLQNQKENISFKCGVAGCPATFKYKYSLKRHQRKTGHNNVSINPTE